MRQSRNFVWNLNNVIDVRGKCRHRVVRLALYLDICALYFITFQAILIKVLGHDILLFFSGILYDILAAVALLLDQPLHINQMHKKCKHTKKNINLLDTAKLTRKCLLDWLALLVSLVVIHFLSPFPTWWSRWDLGRSCISS